MQFASKVDTKCRNSFNIQRGCAHGRFKDTKAKTGPLNFNDERKSRKWSQKN